LGSFTLWLDKAELDAMHRPRLKKSDPDLLFTFLRSAPARAIIRSENRIDGESMIFRCDFDRGDLKLTCRIMEACTDTAGSKLY
jgi:hypothetical protein